MRRHRNWVIAIALAAGGAAGGFWAAERRHAPAQDPAGPGSAPSRPAEFPERIVTVEVVRPERTTLGRTATFPGTIQGYDEADLFAKVTGYVSRYHVDIGDHVKAGQELAVISVPELDEQYREAQAQLAADIATDKAAEARIVQARSMLDVARRQLARANAQLALQDITFRRESELHAGKALTDEALDVSRKNLQVAQADTATDEARIAAAEADVRTAEANKTVTTAQIAVARSRATRLGVLVGYERIVAPFDGLIARRWIDIGNLAQPGSTTPLYTIQRCDLMRIIVYIPEYEVAYMHVGMPATVTLYGPARISRKGEVSRTASEIHFDTRTMRVEVDLPNTEGHLLHGRYVEVAFDLDRQPNRLTLPNVAVITEGKEQLVYVVRDERVLPTPVQTGLTEAGRKEIVAGLDDDALVVLNAKTAPELNARVRAVLRENK